MPRTILLDFDGTLTDVEEEAKPFLVEWNILLSQATGIPASTLLEGTEKVKSEVLSDPNWYGWKVNGHIVAPATADPYVLATTLYQILFDRIEKNGSYDISSFQRSRDQTMQGIFKEAYKKAGIVFLEGSRDFLETLIKYLSVRVVTNSDASNVRNKLQRLTDYPVGVIGDAKKYDVPASPDPEFTHIKGLDRKVFLTRPNYRKILDEFDPKETAVVGDIYELDLALPEHMGFTVVQIATPNTPSYEIAHHEGRPRNFFARNYSEALGFLFG
ncbi:MAG TPA: hypothetical protein VJH04_02605 [archaeon]|nr:hypothetical protein [archaeon]